MSMSKRAVAEVEDVDEDAGVAKRCKEQPRWLRVEELFFKWYAFVRGTVAAHWPNLSYDTFIAAGMLPMYSEARQRRIVISTEVPEDQRGFDGVVFDGDIPVLAQVKDHARPIGAGALGATYGAILRIRQKNAGVRSLIASTSGFTEEVVEMDAPLLNVELLNINYDMMKAALEPPPAPFQLRGIQVEAIAAMKAWLTEAVKQFVLGMPPGSGKTLAVAHFLLELQERLALLDVIIASPTRVLVQQTETVLRGVLPHATFVTVGSDGTTSPDAIFAGKDDGRPLIISTTFDSAHVVADAICSGGGRDTILFVDEAHLYNRQLDQLRDCASKVCLVSGTPTGIPLGLLEAEFAEYTVSMERAAAEGFIVPPRMFYPIGVDLKDDSVEAKCEFIAVTSLREDNGMRRPLIFAKDKKEAAAFIAALAEEYASHGVSAAGRVLTGDTTQREREALRAWFEGGDGGNEARFITCVHVPNQGVDFPRCDGVFVTTIANRITALQRICRAVRTYPGKTFCSVLLWMSDKNLLDVAQLGLGAANVRCITAHLEATDVAKETVATVRANEQLRALVAAQGTISYREWSWWRRTDIIEMLGGCGVLKRGQIEDGFDVYRFMNKQRQRRREELLTDAQITRFDELGMIWNPFEERDARFLEEYSAFLTRGETPVRSKAQRTAQRLVVLRSAYKKGKLSDAMIDALEALPGHKWISRPGYETYVKAIDHCRVKNITIVKRTSLADFEGFTKVNVGEYRQHIRCGETSLTPEQRATLTTLGFL